MILLFFLHFFHSFSQLLLSCIFFHGELVLSPHSVVLGQDTWILQWDINLSLPLVVLIHYTNIKLIQQTPRDISRECNGRWRFTILGIKSLTFTSTLLRSNLSHLDKRTIISGRFALRHRSDQG